MKISYVVIGSLAFLASCGTKKGEQSKDSSTLSTIDVAFMSNSIKPTEDFFMFSNENWIKSNPVPDSESRWGSFNELDKANKEKLTQILNDAMNANATKGSMNQILGDYYASFSNMDIRNKVDLMPIQKDYDQIQNLKSIQEIPAVLNQLHKQGVDALFGFGVDQDLKNVTQHTVYFGQSGIGLPNKTYYTDDSKQELRDKYLTYITKIFARSGAAREECSNMARLVLRFETTLARGMMKPEEMRIPELTYNPMNMADFNKAFGQFKISEYIKNTGIGDFNEIIVGQPDYIRTISSLYTDENLDLWKNYLSFCLLNHYAGHLSDDFERINFDFYGMTLSGKKVMKPINERAIDELTHKSIGELLGKAFVEKYFSEEAKNRVDKMVDNLLSVYEERINGLEWMSAETKTQALLKLHAIGRKLGFPSKWEDFSSINITPENYIGNLKAIAEYDYEKNISKLNKPIDKEEWGMPAHMVNAYYNPLLNEIAFPAGIMQPPFFDNNAEDAVNYGRIGMVIGHEFTHGFDDMGSKFAANGNFENWWTEGDREAFEKKTEVLGETFAHFCPIEGNCVNPSLTMGENIADLGGLTMAYYAYARTEEFKSGTVRNGYTPAQRFFIAYAQLWKINYTDAELKKRIATDPHSPGMYRVNGPLMNCPEFFEAFGVKEGDTMRNSEGKVARIW